MDWKNKPLFSSKLYRSHKESILVKYPFLGFNTTKRKKNMTNDIIRIMMLRYTKKFKQIKSNPNEEESCYSLHGDGCCRIGCFVCSQNLSRLSRFSCREHYGSRRIRSPLPLHPFIDSHPGDKYFRYCHLVINYVSSL